jgi:hypothetical protein
MIDAGSYEERALVLRPVTARAHEPGETLPPEGLVDVQTKRVHVVTALPPKVS